MIKVYWRFKGNKIGGVFRNLWDGAWYTMGKYSDYDTAENAVRQWKNFDWFRKSFEFSIGVNLAK